MELIELYVIYRNAQTEECENIEKLDIDPSDEPDFSLGPDAVKTQQEGRFFEVPLPNGESIQQSALYRTESEGFTINVKQSNKPILQVLCWGMPSIAFCTLSGKSINLQVHPRGAFPGNENQA